MRRRQAYAGGSRGHIAANDNPLPERPRRLKAGWILSFAIAAVLVLAFI